MGLSSGFESNAIGGMGFGGIGGGYGFGGGGIIEGLLLGTLLRGRGGFGGNDCEDNHGVTSLNADGIAAKTALLVNQNADQNALLQALINNKDTTVAEGRNLSDAICEAEKTNLQQFYAAAIQAANNTQAIKDQATGYAIVADKRFDDLAAQSVNQTASILARINDVENQGLRDQLAEARHYGRSKEQEINITNSNNAVATQLQAQSQWQVQKDHDNERRFDAIFSSFNQLNRNTQDVINFGTMAASANQANSQTNVK